MAVFSSWRDEISLSEVVTDNLNSKKDKKITGDGVNNKKLIKVFPNSSEEFKEQVAPAPSDREADAKTQQLKQRERRINLAKRQILQKKMQAVRSGAGSDITASHQPEGDMVEGAIADRLRANISDKKKKFDKQTQEHNKWVKDQEDAVKAAKDREAAFNSMKEEVVDEAKVDAGKSPEEKEKDRNVRKFGVSHNVAGHGKLRRALHRSDRGDKKIKGDKTQWVETEEVALEEVGISSSAAMEKARKEAELKAKEDAAIKKAKKIKEEPEMESYELTEELINDSIEDAIDYFSKQGINEEGLDLVIEEVGLDDFVEFVLDPSEDLMEEGRKARKAKVSAKSYAQVKAEVDASDAAKKASGKGEYAKSYAKRSGETEDSTNYDDKPAAKKKAAPKKAAPKKPAVKKVTVKKAAPAKKAETKKKVVAATQTAKKKQPLKPISKPGLGSKIRSAVSKGVERHKEAVGKAKTEVGKVVKTAKTTAKQHAQHRKDFVKGISPTDKEKKIAKGVGGAVKKALTREELELLEELSRRLLEDEDYGYDKDGKSLNPKDKKEDEPEDDYRAMWTKANLVRQKLRAMGLNMSNELEGDLITDEYTVTNADKKGNTVAWQRYKQNVKNVKTGKPLYKAADHVKEEITLKQLEEKLAKGTKRVSFSTGEDDNYKQAMKEKNPRTGRMRATTPELKAIGAHSRHKKKQWDAEAKGDYKAAAKHKSRRDAQACTVYQKTRRIIDRADND